MERDLNQIAALWKGNASHSFEELSQYVVETHMYAQGSAIKAINQMAILWSTSRMAAIGPSMATSC